MLVTHSHVTYSVTVLQKRTREDQSQFGNKCYDWPLHHSIQQSSSITSSLLQSLCPIRRQRPSWAGFQGQGLHGDGLFVAGVRASLWGRWGRLGCAVCGWGWVFLRGAPCFWSLCPLGRVWVERGLMGALGTWSGCVRWRERVRFSSPSPHCPSLLSRRKCAALCRQAENPSWKSCRCPSSAAPLWPELCRKSTVCSKTSAFSTRALSSAYKREREGYNTNTILGEREGLHIHTTLGERERERERGYNTNTTLGEREGLHIHTTLGERERERERGVTTLTLHWERERGYTHTTLGERGVYRQGMVY